MKKFELTDNTIVHRGRTLHQIICVEPFGDIKLEDLGGWIEKKENLSQEDNCWVYNDAKVFDDAFISDNAKIYNNAQVFNSARVCGHSKIYNYSQIFGNANVLENAKVFDYAEILGNSIVHGRAQIYGYSLIRDFSNVYDNAYICDRAYIGGNALIHENAKIQDNATVWNFAEIKGNSIVKNNVEVNGNAVISGNAVLTHFFDFIIFKNWWSSGRYFTWTRSNNMWSVGCFYGTGDELIRKAYKDSKHSGINYEKIVNYVNNILQSEKQNK